MSEPTSRVAELLHEAAETHHRVYRITNGTDDCWASWYAGWLTRLSELPDLLSRRPVRSELTFQLVTLDRAYAAEASAKPWEEYYAERLVEVFS